ncbi:hypothetical protein V2G26_014124 [Clonostachys chloroleuca]
MPHPRTILGTQEFIETERPFVARLGGSFLLFPRAGRSRTKSARSSCMSDRGMALQRKKEACIDSPKGFRSVTYPRCDRLACPNIPPTRGLRTWCVLISEGVRPGYRRLND